MRILTLILLTFSLAVARPASAQEPSFATFGYFDFAFEYDPQGSRSSFDMHRFNLITTYTFDQFRIFGELEWEHGAKIEADELSEGEVGLERAWIEYIYSNKLRFQAGKFLTPFGIYNLLHDATPTFLTVSLPYIYREHNPFGQNKGRLYAKFYTGLQLYGTLRTESGIQFRYTLGIGNGRGTTQFSSDNDTNKALIARLQANYRNIDLGLSHYRDRQEEGLSGKAGAREEAYAADLTFNFSGLQLQSEYAYFRLENQQSRFQKADAYYSLLSYRIKEMVTPFVRYDYLDPNKDQSNDAFSQWLIGVNISPHPQIYLKSEIQFKSYEATGIPRARFYESAISVAF